MPRYKELKSIYYGNFDDYEREYKERYESPDSLRLDLDINGYPAFLVCTQELWDLIYTIQKLNQKIITIMYKDLPGKALSQYKKKCLIDEVVLTNQIEGVSSTRREIKDILDKISKNKSKKRFESIVGKYTLLDGISRIHLNDNKDIRKLYDEFMLEEVLAEDSNNAPDGKVYRKDRVEVKDTSGQTIHEGVYPESKVIEYMDKALNILNDEGINFFFRLCIFHYLFGYIHPFYDGNGRTNRFISSYLLTRETNELAGLTLSKSIMDNRSKYYSSFNKTNDKKNRGDLTIFAQSFLQIINYAIEELYNTLNYKKTEFNTFSIMLDYRTQGMDEKTRRLYYLLLQASLFADLGISMEELTAEFSVSRVTMGNRLKEIYNKGELVVNTSGHYKYYSLNLDVLKSKTEKGISQK